MLLSGKVAIVTGGGRGIGADISRVLGREGATVAVNYSSSAEKAEKIVKEIKENGGTAQAFRADVRDPESVNTMVKAVAETFGRIDGLVNNAIGGRQHGKLSDLSLDDFGNMFDFNCKAVINTINAVRPFMVKQGGGRIVNIVTELWNMGSGEWAAYLAGKGAMVGLSRALANELGPENITVNMVAPGWMADEKVDINSEGSKNFAKTLPLRRQGSAQEIGNVCAFYLSHLAGYVTGTYIPVCGGRITQMGA
jgi:3-oxoacyl-[acyl-carrier protein] reductase